MEQGAYSVLLQMLIQLVLRPQGLRCWNPARALFTKPCALCRMVTSQRKREGRPTAPRPPVHLPRQGHLLKLCACSREGRKRVCVCVSNLSQASDSSSSMPASNSVSALPQPKVPHKPTVTSRWPSAVRQNYFSVLLD